MKRYLVVTLLALGLVVSYTGCKKDESSVAPPAGVTQLNTNGTLAPISRTQAQGTMFVTDQDGNPVTGITSQEVGATLRWGTPGPGKVAAMDSVIGTVLIQTVSQSGKKVAVAMTMDYSGSMFTGDYDTTTNKYSRILDMEKGVKSFVNAMATGDIAEIIKFGSHGYVDVVQPFTSSKALLLKAADTLSESRGSTALFESIVKSITDASLQSSTTYARAVIAFTDGGENDSPMDIDSVFAASRHHVIPVYTVGLIDSYSHSTPPGQNYPETDLVAIADSTGGFYFYAPDASQLAQIYAKISGQISNAFTVTITWPGTSLPPAGTGVTAIITVNHGGLVSSYQRTYVLP